MLFDQDFNENRQTYNEYDDIEGHETVSSGITQEVLDKNYTKSNSYKMKLIRLLTD